MTYKEMNEFCKENNVYGTQVYVAEEMDYYLYGEGLINPTDERFEQLCGLAHYLYLKSEDISIISICRALCSLEEEFQANDGKDPLEMDKWAILDLAAMEE